MDALMIGISGMRGTIGGSLTPAVVSRMATALICWLKNTQQPANGSHFKIVIGRDSRPSGPWVRDAAVSALVGCGAEVIDLDVVSTPGVAMMVQHLKADAGVVVTASHNPIQWNGLKFLNRHAVAPPPEDALAIRAFYDSQESATVTVDKLKIAQKNSETHALHNKRVLDRVDVLGIASKRYKVVLDSVNGAGCVATAMMLGKLGCEVIHLNGTPNGQFAHEPEPTEANLTQLADEVKRHKAQVGFAQDPDADRLAVVDDSGKYIGEEYSLALCARLILSKKTGIAVTNLSSSRMLDDIAQRYGSTVRRTAVGEANVVAAMLETGAPIGGEGNGGVIDTRIVPGRDSMVGMAYVLQLMANEGKKLSEIVADIPKYEIVKTKFECRREDANRAVEALKKAFASEKVDTQDGIRIDWDKAWVHARPSNTEPIMRIIAEAPTRQEADQRVAQVREIVNKTL